MATPLKELLKPWASLPTWHTGHPKDMERFHLAIQEVAFEHGTSLNEEELAAALRPYVENTTFSLGNPATEADVEKWAERAVVILSYLGDTR